MHKPVFLVIMGVCLLAVGMVGCKEETIVKARSEGREGFVTDRVVEVRIVMDEDIWRATQSEARAQREQYELADFWFDGELVPDVAVRPKGSSSLKYVLEDESIRLSLKVDFNLFNNARTFRGLKKLNFHNNFRDPTLMRERLAYELFSQMDIPVPRTSHVDLWVNETHLGVYTQVEQADKTFLRRNFGDGEGNLYKPVPPGSFLNWEKKKLEEQRAELGIDGSDDSDAGDVNLGGGSLSEIQRALSDGDLDRAQEQASSHSFDYLDYMLLKMNNKKPNHSALLRFLDVLNNEPDRTFPEEIEKVLDVDEALRFIAVETILVNLDSYLGRGLNYYLYEEDGKFTLIPWDLNESFGTYKCDIDRQGIIDFYIDEPTCGPVAERPLVDRLLSYQPYLDAYHGYLEELLSGPFSLEAMGWRIDEVVGMIRAYVEADDLKFFTTEEFEKNLDDGFGRFFGLKEFVQRRGESVRQQLDGLLPSAGDGSGNGGDPDKA